MKTRCPWADGNNLYQTYHDKEWGVPLHDDKEIFGFLLLEGAQAGLSWLTILKKRGNYRQAFRGFDPAIVARFSETQTKALLNNAGIIRNRLKILSAVNNAQRFMEIQQEFGSFDTYQWQFIGNKPKQNFWTKVGDIPAVSPEAIALSNDLGKRGFKFVGPKIIYAHMQATGMVNDHIVSCFRHNEVERLTK